jgi:thiol-disulfide isomerase/thioredoxin
MNARAVIFAGIVALVGLGGFLLLQTTTVTSTGVRVGHIPVAAAACHDSDDCLPDFTATTVDGRTVTRADFVGKVVLVNFWASWCHPCVKEIPDLEATFRKFGPEGFAILAIAQDGDDASNRQFAADHQMSYVIVRSNPVLDHAFGKPQFLPTSQLYGKDGHRQLELTGGVTAEQLAGLIQTSQR